MPPLLLPEHAAVSVPWQRLLDSGRGGYKEMGVWAFVM